MASQALTHHPQPQSSFRCVDSSRAMALRTSTSETMARSLAGSFGQIAYAEESVPSLRVARAEASARTAAAVRGRSLSGLSRSPAGGERGGCAAGSITAGWCGAGGERSLGGLTLGSEDALGGDTRGAGGGGGSVAARALREGERLALGLGLAGDTRRGTEGLTCRRGCAL